MKPFSIAQSFLFSSLPIALSSAWLLYPCAILATAIQVFTWLMIVFAAVAVFCWRESWTPIEQVPVRLVALRVISHLVLFVVLLKMHALVTALLFAAVWVALIVFVMVVKRRPK
ncbi:MAG: hypothetical protein VB141_13485 [Burkholderia gladioli]